MHIAEAAALIARYLEGVSKGEFLGDTLRQDAVIRRIQIIGEPVRLHEPTATKRQANVA